MIRDHVHRPSLQAFVAIRPIGLAALALAAAFVSGPAAAQNFPERPVRVLVPYPAGGPVDTLARALGEDFRKRTGQGFVIENKPGANTSIAAQNCKSADPDGYTLCFLASTTLSLNPHLYKKLRYTPADLAPVSNVATTRAVFLLHKSVPANNLEELVEYSKKHPEKMNYGSFGVGGETHLMVEWLKKKTGLQMTHVPFAGFAPAIQSFDRGDIQVMIPVAVPPILDRIQKKQAKALMILGDNRAPNLPDVPSVPDLGLPKLNFQTWFGMFVPKGTPADRIEKLSAEIRAIVANKAFADKFMRAAALLPATSTPAEFKSFLEADDKNAADLIKTSGVVLAE